MKDIIKNSKVAIIIVGLCMFFTSSMVFADDVEVKQINDKNISDINKVWIVKFIGDIDFYSVKNSIQVKDNTDDSIANVTITKGDDNASVKINPPSQGYKNSHTYEIKIDKNIAKSKKQVKLSKSALMNFTVTDSNTDTTNNNNTYTASANVIGSPYMPMLKQITLKSTTLPNVKKYRVKEIDNMVNIGVPMIAGVAENATTVYFYDANGNKLGEALLNVDKSLNNMTIQVITQN